MPRPKNSYVVLVLSFCSLVVLPVFARPASAPASPGQKAPAASPASTPDALALVEKIGERIASYPKLDSWRAKALSTSSRMTSEWKPKSTTVSEKIVTVDAGLWSEEILSATETEGGKTRDVTKEAQKEAQERAAKQKRSPEKEGKEDKKSGGRGSLDMTREELLPFGPDKRSGYDFTIEGQRDLNGAPAILVRSRSRVRSDEKFEGLYFVDPATHDVRRAELTMAKRPAPLKRMEMEFDFQVLPEGYQVMKRSLVRIHVGVIVKNVRVEALETYSDYVVR